MSIGPRTWRLGIAIATAAAIAALPSAASAADLDCADFANQAEARGAPLRAPQLQSAEREAAGLRAALPPPRRLQLRGARAPRLELLPSRSLRIGTRGFACEAAPAE